MLGGNTFQPILMFLIIQLIMQLLFKVSFLSFLYFTLLNHEHCLEFLYNPPITSRVFNCSLRKHNSKSETELIQNNSVSHSLSGLSDLN